ncbi:YIP1 family protein [bacterium]|nr:YIP1 family protein [bacterium]
MKSFTRLITVIYDPKSVFTEARLAPLIAVPLILFTLLTTAYSAYYYLKIDIDYIFDKQIQMSGKADIMDKVPEEQRQISKKMMQYGGIFSGLFLIPLWFCAIALYLFVVAKIRGEELTFSQCMTVPVYSYSISFLSILVGFLIMLTSDFSTTLMQDLVPSNVAYFVDLEASPDNTSRLTLLHALDVFTLWHLIVMSIGTMVVLKIKPLLASLLIFVPWLLMIGISVLVSTLF